MGSFYVQLRNSPERYGLVAIALHWAVAMLFLGQVALGTFMTALPLTDPRVFPLYQTHKSIGFVIFLLVVIRLVWRATGQTPPPPATLPRWQARAAVAIHFSLYAALLLMPLLGWVIVSASPLGIPTLIFGKFEIPHLAFVVESSNRQMIGSVASWAHWALAWAASIAVCGHIAAALLHHIVKKDTILKRMLPTRAHFQSEPLA